MRTGTPLNDDEFDHSQRLSALQRILRFCFHLLQLHIHKGHTRHNRQFAQILLKYNITQANNLTIDNPSVKDVIHHKHKLLIE